MGFRRPAEIWMVTQVSVLCAATYFSFDGLDEDRLRSRTVIPVRYHLDPDCIRMAWYYHRKWNGEAAVAAAYHGAMIDRSAGI